MDVYFFKSFHIAGFMYYQGAFVFDELKVGKKVDLHLEKDNIHDENAVEILYKGNKLGYIPKDVNREIATLLKAGYKDIFAAVIQQIQSDVHPEQQVKIGVFIKAKNK